MQQCIFDVFDIPWILQELLFLQTSFGRKVSLIFPIIYQIVDQNVALWSLPTGAWMPELSSFNWFGSNSLSSLLDFREIRCVLASSTSSTLKLLKFILLYLIWSCLTSLLDDCVWGTQGVQLLNWSDPGQVQVIRFRRVWVSWHPSI